MIFLDSTYKWYMFVFLYPIYFTEYDNLQFSFLKKKKKVLIKQKGLVIPLLLPGVMYDMGVWSPRKELKDAEDKNSGVSEMLSIHGVLRKPRNILNVVPAQLMIVWEQVSWEGLTLDLQNSFKDTEAGRQ